MSARTAFISAFQRGRLHSLSSFANLPALAHLPQFDAERLAFSSLLQCGAEYLDLAPIPVPEPLNRSILSDRIKPHNLAAHRRNAAAIDAVFRSHLPGGYVSDFRFRAVGEARSLLADIFYAAEVDRSVVSFSPLSRSSDGTTLERDTLLGVLPAHLALPVLNLFRSVKPIEAECVLPRLTLKRDSAKRLAELMSSELFRSYQAEHSELAEQGSNPAAAARRLSTLGRSIWRRFRRTVDLRRTVIGVLPAVPKVVEVGFGSLPGAIAERASEAASRILRRRASIIIYDMSSLVDEVTSHRMRSLMHRPDTVERLGQLMDEIRIELRYVQTHLK